MGGATPQRARVVCGAAFVAGPTSTGILLLLCMVPVGLRDDDDSSSLSVCVKRQHMSKDKKKIGPLRFCVEINAFRFRRKFSISGYLNHILLQ
jgi:hypothetical protein